MISIELCTIMPAYAALLLTGFGLIGLDARFGRIDSQVHALLQVEHRYVADD